MSSKPKRDREVWQRRYSIPALISASIIMRGTEYSEKVHIYLFGSEILFSLLIFSTENKSKSKEALTLEMRLNFESSLDFVIDLDLLGLLIKKLFDK